MIMNSENRARTQEGPVRDLAGRPCPKHPRAIVSVTADGEVNCASGCDTAALLTYQDQAKLLSDGDALHAEPAPSNLLTDPAHLADVNCSGLTDKTIIETGFRSFTKAELANRDLFGNAAGKIHSAYCIPYPGTDFWRARLIPPIKVEDKNGKEREQKYHQAFGTAPRFYVPKRVRAALAEPGKKLLHFVEGEKKTLAGAQKGLQIVIGTGGVWSFLCDGKPIQDFDDIDYTDCEAELIFDSDIWTKNRDKPESPLHGVYALGRELQDHRGIPVSVVKLPADTKGLDDYFLTHSVDEFRALERVVLNDPSFKHEARWYQGWVVRKRIEAAKADATVRGDRLIDLDSMEPRTQVDAAIAALAQRNDPPRLFERARVLTRLEVDDAGADLRQMDYNALLSELNGAARFGKVTKIGLKFEFPPSDIVNCILGRATLGLPRIDRIANSPFFAADGTLVATPGYNAAARTFLHLDRMFTHELRPIPEKPSASDVAAARELLFWMIRHFPLGIADRANSIALELLLFVGIWWKTPCRSSRAMHRSSGPAKASWCRRFAHQRSERWLSCPRSRIAAAMSFGRGSLPSRCAAIGSPCSTTSRTSLRAAS